MLAGPARDVASADSSVVFFFLCGCTEEKRGGHLWLSAWWGSADFYRVLWCRFPPFRRCFLNSIAARGAYLIANVFQNVDVARTDITLVAVAKCVQKVERT